MAVDEAGQHSTIFEVDDLVLGTTGGRVAVLHSRNPVFLHHNGLLAEQLAAAHVEQFAAVQIGFLGESGRGRQQQHCRSQCVNSFARHTFVLMSRQGKR